MQHLVTIVGGGARAQRLLDEFARRTAGVVSVDAEVLGASHKRSYDVVSDSPAGAEQLVVGALSRVGALRGEFAVRVERSSA